MKYEELLALIEEMAQPPNGGSGVTPPFLFSKSGGTGVGSYFFVGNVPTNQSGQTIAGLNKIVKASVSSSGNVAANTVIQFQSRTALSTFTDIATASITIPAGTYKATAILNVNIGPDTEISAYVKSGSTVQNGIVLLYVVPR